MPVMSRRRPNKFKSLQDQQKIILLDHCWGLRVDILKINLLRLSRMPMLANGQLVHDWQSGLFRPLSNSRSTICQCWPNSCVVHGCLLSQTWTIPSRYNLHLFFFRMIALFCILAHSEKKSLFQSQKLHEKQLKYCSLTVSASKVLQKAE